MEFLRTDPQIKENVAIIKLYRPEQLNALNVKLMQELADCLKEFDRDDYIRCIVITGDERAFAAGADIKEMAGKGTIDMHIEDRFATWESIRRIKKPIIAAVNGFALGGGCELAMTCDMIVAGESARFGQPEIKIGVMPGAGGTQRLTKALGKAKAMELILTGGFLSAEEAFGYGLVNRVVPDERCVDSALELASEIASMSPIATQLAKEAVNKSFETHLNEGLTFERKNFYMTFSSEDQKEGMNAFVEKRKPDFKGK